jgi:hypothetical protein
MFTPQDVIDAYCTKGLKPKFMGFGVRPNDAGVYDTWPDRCACAIGALAVGCDATGSRGPIDWAEAQYPGLNAWAFADGFDGIAFSAGYPPSAVESYELGRQCRLAVLEAFFPEETG